MALTAAGAGRRPAAHRRAHGKGGRGAERARRPVGRRRPRRHHGSAAGASWREALPTLPADVGMALMALRPGDDARLGLQLRHLAGDRADGAAKATRGPHRGAVVGGARAAAGRAGGDDGARQGLARRQDRARRAGRRGARGGRRAGTRRCSPRQPQRWTRRWRRCAASRPRSGRARIFAERSVGLDDPGMLAFREMLRGLAV